MNYEKYIIYSYFLDREVRSLRGSFDWNRQEISQEKHRAQAEGANRMASTTIGRSGKKREKDRASRQRLNSARYIH